MLTDKQIADLLQDASPDDVIPGAAFVGDGRGTAGSDWHIYDAEAFAC